MSGATYNQLCGNTDLRLGPFERRLVGSVLACIEGYVAKTESKSGEFVVSAGRVEFPLTYTQIPAILEAIGALEADNPNRIALAREYGESNPAFADAANSLVGRWEDMNKMIPKAIELMRGCAKALSTMHAIRDQAEKQLDAFMEQDLSICATQNLWLEASEGGE